MTCVETLFVLQMVNDATNRNSELHYHLAQNCTVEWFGRTLRGKRYVLSFYKYLKHIYAQSFIRGVECEPIEDRLSNSYSMYLSEKPDFVLFADTVERRDFQNLGLTLLDPMEFKDCDFDEYTGYSGLRYIESHGYLFEIADTGDSDNTETSREEYLKVKLKISYRERFSDGRFLLYLIKYEADKPQKDCRRNLMDDSNFF